MKRGITWRRTLWQRMRFWASVWGRRLFGCVYEGGLSLPDLFDDLQMTPTTILTLHSHQTVKPITQQSIYNTWKVHIANAASYFRSFMLRLSFPRKSTVEFELNRLSQVFFLSPKAFRSSNVSPFLFLCQSALPNRTNAPFPWKRRSTEHNCNLAHLKGTSFF